MEPGGSGHLWLHAGGGDGARARRFGASRGSTRRSAGDDGARAHEGKGAFRDGPTAQRRIAGERRGLDARGQDPAGPHSIHRREHKGRQPTAELARQACRRVEVSGFAGGRSGRDGHHRRRRTNRARQWADREGIWLSARRATGPADRGSRAGAVPRGSSRSAPRLLLGSAYAPDGCRSRALRAAQGWLRVPGGNQLVSDGDRSRQAGHGRHSRHHGAQTGGGKVPRPARGRPRRHRDREPRGQHRARQRADRSALRLRKNGASRRGDREARTGAISGQAPRVPHRLLPEAQRAFDGVGSRALRPAQGRQ